MSNLSEVAVVALLGLATTSSSIVGAALGLYVPLSKRLLACVLAFAAGALISALAIELAFEGAVELVHQGFSSNAAWEFVGGGFALGSIILMLLGIPFVAAIFTLIFGQGAAPDWTRSAIFIYLSGAFVSIHPFIALGLTETLLSNGDSPFFSIIDPQGANVPIPSPWLAYVVLAALFSAALIWLSMRMLRPAPPIDKHARLT